MSITGSSALSPGGFYTQQYTQDSGNVFLTWSHDFSPQILDDERGVSLKASEVNIDKTTGNIIVTAMIWGGERISRYAIQSYSPQGDIIYTVDYGIGGDGLARGDNLQNAVNVLYELNQNFPNPFNPSTVISYSLAATGNVNLKVYDAAGKEIVTLVNELQPAGNYEAKFNASDLPSGIYYYKLSSGEFVDTKRMILIK